MFGEFFFLTWLFIIMILADKLNKFKIKITQCTEDELMYWLDAPGHLRDNDSAQDLILACLLRHNAGLVSGSKIYVESPLVVFL